MPEITAFVRIEQQNTSIRHEEKHFQDLDMLMVDFTFFDFFDFRVLEGDPGLALTHPTFLILTKSLADKLFPGNDALNQPVDINLSEVNLSAGQMNQVSAGFHVGAVIEDPPTNTHLQFDLLTPVHALDKARFTMGAQIFCTYPDIDERISLIFIQDRINSF